MINTKRNPFVRWLHEVDNENIREVGGKNASLGEMLKYLSPKGINIPRGFAITAYAYYKYLEYNKLEDLIKKYLNKIKRQDISLEEGARTIRKNISNGIFPIPMAQSIRDAYSSLCVEYDTINVDVAVRSSATAEDLPSASFAGLQETYLNIRGEEELLKACKKCFASLFTVRAIVYREEKGFDHLQVGLSIGVQKMVRSDDTSSGVIFTIDTESGFPDVVVVNGSWGLGENVVRGVVNPDQFLVFKPLIGKSGKNPILEKKLGSKEQKMVYASDEDGRTRNINTTAEERSSYVLNDDEILKLASWASIIEEHYGKAMDIEWVKGQDSKQLYIVQARPETVHSVENTTFKDYKLLHNHSNVLLTGLSIGNSIVSGKVKKIKKADDLQDIAAEDILVTQMTEPDWVPYMKQAAGIITDSGGRTCHAAIVSRELGIPAVVGTHFGTSVLKDGQEITLSCSEGDEGKIYQGILKFDVREIDLSKIKAPKTQIMLNLAAPESAFKWWRLPTSGVGLARMEFIVSQHIKVHPMALVHFEKVSDEKEREQIRKLTHHYEDKTTFFVTELAMGISKIAASQYPKPVIVRTSDFKTNEYANLIGGSVFEPLEQNPMLGWRGACRYYSEGYREGFALECRALKMVREEIGLDNVIVMIPFCRTVDEARKVLEEMAVNGLKRGQNGLQVYMMCEIPANVILAEDFARYFDGFSIGSNDLTQLILGVDRDSAALSFLFDEHNAAVKTAIKDVIKRAHKAGIKIGFCGQAPSDDPKYATFLVESGIDSVSLNPDSVIDVINQVNKIEKTLIPAKA
ncbi:MAG TPA: phosphoenolpyruvate synthase [Balneolaceae bacterium]|nr:phosphoenolpyruvate synthase [Balneolaceae bacterium]